MHYRANPAIFCGDFPRFRGCRRVRPHVSPTGFLAQGLAVGAFGWMESHSASLVADWACGALIPAIHHHAASALIDIHGFRAGRVFYQNFYQNRPLGRPANSWIVCVAGGS